MPVAIERIEPAYKGWLKLFLAHMTGDDGARFTRTIEDHGPGCAVLPYDAERRVALLVKLPRAPVMYLGESEMVIEAPAGLIDAGEAPDVAARREAMEEVGVELSTLDSLGTIWSMPGISTERMSLFLGAYSIKNRTGLGGGLAHEQENITVVEMPLAELARLADENQLTDMRTLAMVQTLRLRRPDLFG